MKNLRLFFSLFFFLCICFVKAQVPTITSISSITDTAGALLTITGTNFNAVATNNIVYFGATQATVNTATSTNLVVVVPKGASFGTISVLNTSTGLLAKSGNKFYPSFKPTVTTFDSSNFVQNGILSLGSPNLAGWTADILLLDLDGDGRPDLINMTTYGYFTIYRNSGGSDLNVFDIEPKYYQVNSSNYNVNSITSGDVNGDGKIDLIATCESVYVYINTSTFNNISFASPINLSVGTNKLCFNSLVEDVNNDGKQDILIAYSSMSIWNATLAVFQNTSSLNTLSFTNSYNYFLGIMSYNRNSPSSTDLAFSVNDLDGDGKLDIHYSINTYYSGPGHGILRNTSSVNGISFQNTGLSQNLGFGYYADFDLDGKLDLLADNAMYRNTSSIGNISFANPITTSYTSNLLSDLNGDGKLDMCVPNTSANTLSIIFNNSTNNTISFAPKLDFNLGRTQQRVIISDIDLDGKPNISIINSGYGFYSYSFNPKSTANLSSITTNVGMISPVFNQNKTDYTINLKYSDSILILRPFAVNASNGVVISLNNGSYTTIIPGSYSAPMTLNAGENIIKVKVIALNNVEQIYTFKAIRLNAIPIINSFTPVSDTAGASITINGSFFNPTASKNLVLFGTTYGVVTSSSANTLSVVIPKGAGLGPISVLNTDNSMMTLSKTNFVPKFAKSRASVSASDFDTKENYVLPDSISGLICIADMDNDGKPDMIVSNKYWKARNIGSYYMYVYNKIFVLRNKSIGDTTCDFEVPSKFTDLNDFSLSGNNFSITKNVKIVDIDQDGKLDIIILNRYNVVTVLLNTSSVGKISFAIGNDFAIKSTIVNPVTFEIADIDMDGFQDLCVSSQADSTISIYRNLSTKGYAYFAPYVSINSGKISTVNSRINIKDLDTDGKPEIIVSNDYSAIVLRNTSTIGSISFANKSVLSNYTSNFYFPDFWFSDFDGDSKTDMLSMIGSNLVVLKNNCSVGNISFSQSLVNLGITTSSSLISAISDINGDGKPDVCIGWDTTGNSKYKYAVLKNNSTLGSINFSAKADLTLPAGNNITQVNDMNNDGKPDLISVNSSNGVSVILNVDPKPSLVLKAYLQGLYLGNGTMISSPFSANGTSPRIIADTITIELRGTTNSHDLVYSAKGLLDTSGNTTLSFPSNLMGNSYYVVVKHRNSIATWSANAITLSANTSFNFTNSMNNAFGDNLVDDGTGKFLIYSGDINQDGSVDFNDYPYIDIASNIGLLGYDANDLNGDASVDFNDYPILDTNSNIGVIELKP